ncbi:unnamed protein product [Orchesella dallaii]|uniref:Beta/gamma crystallin 'Greek key' domain-containing protein n=1 Tax=Orchesella dallaii TaxID=48710 RepID=A0ABP1RSZ6_9HEXA
MSLQIRATFLLEIVFVVVVSSYAAQQIGSAYRAAKILVFDDVNGGGAFYEVEVNNIDCTNVRGDWNDRISSINTRGSCVIGYEHRDCGGRGERFAPGTPHHGDLTNLGFNDAITSFKLC